MTENRVQPAMKISDYLLASGKKLLGQLDRSGASKTSMFLVSDKFNEMIAVMKDVENAQEVQNAESTGTDQPAGEAASDPDSGPEVHDSNPSANGTEPGN